MIGRGKINLLIDASAFDGWEDTAAFRAHATFVKDQVRPRQNVERLAVIIGHEWQRALVAVLSTFLHPHVRAFDKADLAQAIDWVKTGADWAQRGFGRGLMPWPSTFSPGATTMPPP